MRTKEEIALYAKEWREKNKIKVKEASEIYREKNKEILKEKKRLYDKKRREEIGDKLKEENLKYYYDNKDDILEKQRVYRELNKDEINSRKKEQRHLQRSLNPIDEFIKGTYNITLAERHKELWLKETLYFYHLKLVDDDGTVFYKYGLTKNLKSRLWQIPYKVEILENILLNKYEAIWKEYDSLKKVNRYTPQRIFGGYTECFN